MEDRRSRRHGAAGLGTPAARLGASLAGLGIELGALIGASRAEVGAYAADACGVLRFARKKLNTGHAQDSAVDTELVTSRHRLLAEVVTKTDADGFDTVVASVDTGFYVIWEKGHDRLTDGRRVQAAGIPATG
jgi:hypothetical protein